MIEQMDGIPLSNVLRNWKSFTAKEIYKLRGFQGNVWAADYFDRFIRDAEHFANAVSYIENNHVKAGLRTRAQDWPYSSASESAGGTPAVPGKLTPVAPG
jgi:REP element-mobilizing transposase RayT